MNVDDVVNEQIAAAERRRRAQRDRRKAFNEARQHGLRQRHATKLVRIGRTEQVGARLALAALDRDSQTVAAMLSTVDPQQARQAAAVALGALAELGLTARPGNLTRARDALLLMERSAHQDDDPPPAA
ncbi:hypothetical protein [Streptomyces mangrovi]|uniref:hypothetical protein n=1 Tax=Streptomyces mangrovi TaxID=1206892 RepID=UPI00399CDF35